MDYKWKCIIYVKTKLSLSNYITVYIQVCSIEDITKKYITSVNQLKTTEIIQGLRSSYSLSLYVNKTIYNCLEKEEKRRREKEFFCRRKK